MNAMTGSPLVSAPTHEASEFLNYELECRAVLKPLLANLLDKAEGAGWARRTAASTLMFLAAQHVSEASKRMQADKSQGK
ncbi:MAG: hypothetical protein IKE42_00205 [Aquamicrobium sp.]|uniref:hypothetical protein n=1 Tax=Mesorhizobium sp. Pch-S TaxID=2082387 RepID=UPI001012C64F|nr:hypothetical protein [Mesorhizobium sp. Pch-S]MBR2686247.1 hypothetical protein [Aquamicrobium sp.]QAZ44143.1 hypothetical protein C1M53_15550 [Mesorhizobium sp. Pch-S]